jgi:ubiquinone/menaquinone biosynthesis C-methylase UbiE
MRFDTLTLLRCPYCGSSVELNRSAWHEITDTEIEHALLACRCCEFIVSGGIAVMTLWPEAKVARQAIADARPAEAFRAMLKFGPETPAARLISAQGLPLASYREIAEGAGEGFEGGYFIYRFSDPTFVVADTVGRALATALLDEHSRALDLCGGSGHLTRTLAAVSPNPPVVTDISFVKLWLARHFTAPSADAVVADAEHPLPFATGAFRLAICNDAFHYIWQKALLAREMWRVTDARGAVAITHTHNVDTWTPSQGMALSAEHYRSLFEETGARVYSERAALPDAIGRRLDLARQDPQDLLSQDPAFFVVASREPRVFRHFDIAPPEVATGVLRFSPLYDVALEESQAVLTLRFPSGDYEDEYGAATSYLPALLTVHQDVLAAMRARRITPDVQDLMSRRVIVDLPENYL